MEPVLEGKASASSRKRTGPGCSPLFPNVILHGGDYKCRDRASKRGNSDWERRNAGSARHQDSASINDSCRRTANGGAFVRNAFTAFPSIPIWSFISAL